MRSLTPIQFELLRDAVEQPGCQCAHAAGIRYITDAEYEANEDLSERGLIVYVDCEQDNDATHTVPTPAGVDAYTAYKAGCKPYTENA